MYRWFLWPYPFDTRYAYAVGKVRALEERMIKDEVVQRMIEAATFEEALRILSEVGEYEKDVASLKRPWEFESILEGELKRIIKLILELSKDPQLTNLFRLRYDFHNIKVLLKERYREASGQRKAEISGQRKEEVSLDLLDLGMVGISRLRQMIAWRGIRPTVREYIYDRSRALRRGEIDYYIEVKVAIDEACISFEKDRDLQSIDLVVDKYLFELLYQVLKRRGHLFLRYYISLLADIANLKAFLRLRAQARSKEYFEKFLLDNGHIPKKLFLEFYDGPLHLWVTKIGYIQYKDVVKDGVDYWERSGSFARFERMAEDYIINFLRQARRFAFGAEPLIAYLLAKENEVRLIRAILVGKLSQLSQEGIRENLSISYV